MHTQCYYSDQIWQTSIKQRPRPIYKSTNNDKRIPFPTAQQQQWIKNQPHLPNSPLIYTLHQQIQEIQYNFNNRILPMCRGEAPPGRLLRSAWELQQCAVDAQAAARFYAAREWKPARVTAGWGMASERQGTAASPFFIGLPGHLTDRWAPCHAFGPLSTADWWQGATSDKTA